MMRTIALLMLSGCTLIYDFDDIKGLPCDCARGYICLSDDGGRTGTCALPGTRAQGDTCSQNAHCAEGLICDNAFCEVGQADCVRTCRLGCDPADPASCTSTLELCFPAREEGAQGSGFCQEGNCSDAEPCDVGNICLRDGARAKQTGVCAQTCDPLDTEVCGDGHGCSFWFGDLNQTACDVAGDLPVGASCGGGEGLCVPGSVCLSEPTPSDPNAARCVQLCDPEGRRGEACRSPNPTCAAIPGFALGICTGGCVPGQIGQCGAGFSCQPTDPLNWHCGADGNQCQCGSACDPDTAEDGTCGLAAPCAAHADCPEGMLCGSSGSCRPVCLFQQDVECAPQPDQPNPTCRGIGANPTFGVCE